MAALLIIVIVLAIFAIEAIGIPDGTATLASTIRRTP
jgi:hypothetical protein